MNPLLGYKGYIKAFNTLVRNKDVYLTSHDLALSTINVLSSLSDYLELLLDMRGRTKDIDKVSDIVKDTLLPNELNIVSKLLTVLRDISNGVTMPSDEIGEILKELGASKKVYQYRGYRPIRYNSDIARTYMGTLEKVYKHTVSSEFVPFKLQIAHKRSLTIHTKRVLADVYAYEEVVKHSFNKDIEINKVLNISTYTDESLEDVDGLLRVLLNLAEGRTLEVVEIQNILKSLGASDAVINYINY